MEWVSSWFSQAASNVQSSGPVTKETLLLFFQRGKETFASGDFKDHLRRGHQQGQDVQELINEAQESIFESLGVSGRLGIDSLGKIRDQYANDAEMLRVFYEFVHLEERALDEAELTEGDFKMKYEHMAALQAQMQARHEELSGLSPEERNREVAAMFKKMVESTQGAPCCSNSTCSNHGKPTALPGEGAAMSQEEQLRFFQSLSQGMRKE